MLSIGVLMTDFNTGKFSAKLDPSRTIEVHGQYIKIEPAAYNDVAMQDFLPALSKRLQHRNAEKLDLKPAFENLDAGFTTEFEPNSTATITQQRFWQRLAHFLKEDDIVVAETGTCLFGASVVPLPQETTFVGQVLWGRLATRLAHCLVVASRLHSDDLSY